MQNRMKNIIIISLSLLLVAAFITIFILVRSNRDSLKEIRGTVLVADTYYVIIESEGEDYLINNIKELYEVGDEVKFAYKSKNLDDTSNPKNIEIEEETLIKRSASEEEIPTSENSTNIQKPITKPSANSNSNNNQSNTATNDSPNKEVSTSKTPNKNADKEVLDYVTELENNYKAGSIKDSLKNGFITVIDFLFYNGTIKGHTFNDLSDSAKLKVLSAALYFDSKITEYFPGYKESISSTAGKIYTTAKENIVESYLNVTTLICNNNDELCTSAKENFGKLKNTFGLTWSLIKDIAKDGVANLKKWYEIFSGK